jgi:hypothetical protein
MYSYITEFNLAVRGGEADEFILDSARTWHELWGSVEGVTGTLLLGNAFALGGDFEYQFRVDIKSLSTLARIDEAVKAGKGGWRKSRNDWFRYRTAVRSHLSSFVSGDKKYCHCDGNKEKEGALHAVISSRGSGDFKRSAWNLDAVRGVISTQVLRPVLGSAESSEHTWLRMDSLEQLDDLAGAGIEASDFRLFGEIRELDGSLFAGA